MNMKNKLRLMLCLMISFILIVGATACKGPNNAGKVKPSIKSVSIVGGNITKEIDSGDFTVVAQVESTGEIDRTVTFASSDTNIATITSSGLVHMVGVGTTTISAVSVADSQKSDSITLEVYKDFIPANGGMEDDLPVWGSYPSGVATFSDEKAYEGTRSLKVTSSVYSVVWQGMMIGESKLAGQFISLGAWVYRPADKSGDIKVVLLLENVISETSKPILVRSEATATTVDEWVYIETSTVQIPMDASLVNAKVEFHGTGETVYIDNVMINKEISNSVSLSGVYFDGDPYTAYSNTINTYNAVYSGTLPVVEAAGTESDTKVVITQPTEEDKVCTIEIEAKDGTKRTVTIQFTEVSDSALSTIKVNGTDLVNFDPLRKNYYMTLPKGTVDVPTVTAETYFTETAKVSITQATDLSNLNTSLAQISVIGAQSESVYSIQFQLVKDNQILMQALDTNFDGANPGSRWGRIDATTVDFVSNMGNSGNGSAKIASNCNMWGSGDDNPATGIAISVGAWFYVDSINASGSVEIVVAARDGSSNKIADVVSVSYPITLSDLGKWIWVQSGVSDIAVPAGTFYLQFNVYNKTAAYVYADDIKLFNEGVLT
mgnify:FL=1